MKPKVITPHVEKRAKSQTQKNSPTQQQPKKPEVVVKKFQLDPSFDSMTKNFLEKPEFADVDTDTLTRYLEYLVDYTHYRGMHAEYDEAEQCADLQKLVQADLDSRKPPTSSEDKSTETNFEKRKSEFEEQKRKQLSDFEVETANKLRALSQKQEKDRKEFEEQWVQENTRKYRKPSTQLLQLKRIEKTLAANGEYSSAKAMHKEVAEMSQHEFAEAQKHLIADFEKAERKLNKKFEKEMGILIAARKHDKGLLEARMEAEEENLTKRGRVLKRRPGISQRRTVSNRSSIRALPLTPTIIIDAENEEEFLLPPVIPPNDPKLQEKLKKMREEENKRRNEFQKRNAQETLAKYSLTVPKEEEAKEEPKEEVKEDPKSDVYITGKLDTDDLEVSYVNEDTQA